MGWTYIVGISQKTGTGDKDGPVAEFTFVYLLIGEATLCFPVLSSALDVSWPGGHGSNLPNNRTGGHDPARAGETSSMAIL
jgi:hypothetical protein